MNTRSALALWLCMAMAATPAAAYVASNGLVVQPAGGREFVVPYRRGFSNDTDYWCAAGDYVVRALRLRPGTRVYRMTAPPVRRTAVRFSLDPAGAAKSGLTVFGSKDAGISASLAQVQCTIYDSTDFFDR